MELLTRNNFESWMRKLMERLDRQDELLLSLQPSGKAPNPMERIRMFDNQDLCMLLQISKRTLQRDAMLVTHTLEGAGTHIQQVRRLTGGEQPVCGFFLSFAGNGTHVCRYLSIVITFIFSPFFWFLRQNSAINKRGFNSSLRVSRKIFIGNGSITRTDGATYSLSAGNDMRS